MEVLYFSRKRSVSALVSTTQWWGRLPDVSPYSHKNYHMTSSNTTDWPPGLCLNIWCGNIIKQTHSGIESSAGKHQGTQGDQGGRSQRLLQCSLWDSSRLIWRLFDLRGLRSEVIKSPQVGNVLEMWLQSVIISSSFKKIYFRLMSSPQYKIQYYRV